MEHPIRRVTTIIVARALAEILEEIFALHGGEFAKKPDYVLLLSGGFERVYMIYLYMKDPENIFALRPKIAEEIFIRWDKERARKEQ